MTDERDGRTPITRDQLRVLQQAARARRLPMPRSSQYLSVSVTVHDDGTWVCYLTTKVGGDVHVRPTKLDEGSTELVTTGWLTALLADQASMVDDYHTRHRVLPS